METADWSVPSQAHEDDLVLVYLTRPRMAIEYIYRLTERATLRKAGWKAGKDYRAEIEPVCHLKSPVFLDDMRQHRILKTAPFVRGSMQGKPNAMDYWPYLYEMIIKRNPRVARQLGRYAPERLS
jgi:hypothetical protein